MKLIASMSAVAMALCLSAAAADGLTISANPQALGFSAARLARIAPWYQARFDAFPPSDGLVPGAVVAIAKDGKLAYLQAIGFQDRAKTVPMKPDSIFWIASMSKPVTSVAAMILVDDAKLDLDAPVATYLPEIGNMQVVSEKTGPDAGWADEKLEPPRRPITVRDLLRHTSGIVYPELDFAFPERGLADPAAESRIRRIHALYRWTDETASRRDSSLADFVHAIARLPLAHQPGEIHEYGWSVDVLGRVIEVASGEPLDQFLQRRIFAPLHMVDTGFDVPAAKLDRLVDSPMPERPRIWDVTRPAKLFSGGGGLVSTAPDYLRFCQMLLNGGELDGVRVLNPQAVKAMTTNALPRDIRIDGGDEVGARAGTTFGLGFAIRTNPVFSWIPGAPGSFSWAGYWGTYFWIDPAEKLIGIQMIQATPGSQARRAMLPSGINHLTYGALAIPSPPSAPPAKPPMLEPDALGAFTGTYDFGASVSARDRQGLADGNNGWLGIGGFVAMESQGLRINKIGPSPAATAGVTAGDLVTELDGAPLKGLTLADVLARLRVPANTAVRMKVVHEVQDGARDVSVRAVRRVSSVELRVDVQQGHLVAEATGAWPILEFEKEKATMLEPTSNDTFTAVDDDHTRITFIRDEATGKVSELILNPGPWQQTAAMIAPEAR